MGEAKMLDRKIYKKLDLHLEKIYPQSVQLAEEMKASGLDSKSQLRGFETLVNATSRFSEIINYVKNQAGKDRRTNNWRKVAPKMLEQLEELEKQAHAIAGNDPEKILAVKLRLVRGWARQVVCHFLYAQA